MNTATLLAAGDENVIVPKVSELVVGTLSFALLVAFFFWKIYPQIKRVYAERTERIDGGIRRADEAQEEAQALLAEYRRQLADARADANRLRQEAREQGLAITEELREQARREVAEIKARADEQLAADTAQALAQLRRDVGQIAIELAGRIVGHEVAQDATQRQLVDDFLTGLDAASDAASGAAAPDSAADPAPAGSGS